MAYDDDDDLEPDERWDGNVRNLPAGLRAHVRKLEKEAKAQSEELANLRRESRTRTIQNALAAKGLPTKLAAFVQPDVPATEEALGQWIQDYGDVFNLAPQAQTQPPQGTVDPRTGESSSIPEPQVPQVYDFNEMARAQAQMEAVSAGGQPVEVSGDLMAKIQASNSFEEMEALRGVNTAGRFG